MRYRKFSSWLGGLLLVIGLLAPAPALAEEATDTAVDVAAEVDEQTGPEAEAEPKPPLFLTATVRVTEVREGKDDRIKTFALRKHDNKVRIETEEAIAATFAPQTWYDYDAAESYRLVAADDILFSYHVPVVDRVTALMHGYLTPPENEPVYRLEINKELAHDGHPATLALLAIPTPSGLQGYRWVWEAADLDGLVVKIVYGLANGTVVIIEYLDADLTPFDPAEAARPADKMMMSGF